MVFLNELFEKVDYEKKIADNNKKSQGVKSITS